VVAKYASELSSTTLLKSFRFIEGEKKVSRESCDVFEFREVSLLIIYKI